MGNVEFLAKERDCSVNVTYGDWEDKDALRRRDPR